MYETTGPRDSFRIANTFSIEEFSAVGVCGGDGTVAEVVDGMLKREDGKKLPLWVIPHGSGNVFAMSFRITDLASSL